MAVVSASLPTLRPLVKKLSPKSWHNKSIGHSTSRSRTPRTWGSKNHGSEFERLPPTGNESYAMHYVPGKTGTVDPKSSEGRNIIVTNTVSTTSFE
jgi:hypothetical protein